jgi:hypothetical protein
LNGCGAILTPAHEAADVALSIAALGADPELAMALDRVALNQEVATWAAALLRQAAGIVEQAQRGPEVD